VGKDRDKGRGRQEGEDMGRDGAAERGEGGKMIGSGRRDRKGMGNNLIWAR